MDFGRTIVKFTIRGARKLITQPRSELSTRHGLLRTSFLCPPYRIGFNPQPFVSFQTLLNQTRPFLLFPNRLSISLYNHISRLEWLVVLHLRLNLLYVYLRLRNYLSTFSELICPSLHTNYYSSTFPHLNERRIPRSLMFPCPQDYLIVPFAYLSMLSAYPTTFLHQTLSTYPLNLSVLPYPQRAACPLWVSCFVYLSPHSVYLSSPIPYPFLLFSSACSVHPVSFSCLHLLLVYVPIH